MSELGRIGGQVLTDNLLRNGIDIAVETDLLYLKVSPINTSLIQPVPLQNEDGDPNFGQPGSTSSPASGIGIKTDVPVYDFDVNGDIVTLDLTVQNQLYIDNIILTAPNTVTTSVGGIDILIAGSDIFHERLTTANLEINDNYIASFSNSNITLDPSGAGIVEITATTAITGNLAVGTSASPKNINISGNLSKQGNLILGDQIADTITVNTDFAQSIIPGDDFLWSLGENTGDSSPRRWSEVHGSDWTGINTGDWPGSGLITQNVFVSDQLKLDGVLTKITSLQSNEDIELSSHTGIVYINSTKWQNGDVTNVLNTALQLVSTGIGYTLIAGNNGMVFPAGDNSQRRASPERGETRWSTEEQYLESYDGTVWTVSTGGGIEVTTPIMEDLGHAYSLMLG